MQAAMFGGIVKDSGGTTAKYLFPKPQHRSYPMDLPSVASNLDADFGRFIDESAEVVLKGLRDTQEWMREGVEFGEAWLAHKKGNHEQARIAIRLHVDNLRSEWAATWDIFGKVPRPINRLLLADQFERALWAYFIVQLFDSVIEAVSKNAKLQATLQMKGLDKAEKLEQLRYLQEDWRNGIGHRKWIEAAIVNRLKELNVVFAETDKGKLDQANRMIENAPRPEVHVFGAVDRGVEVEEICGWADFFLVGAADQAAFRFFPPGKQRDLPALPSYR